jgi:hypothetical protein
MGKGLLLSGRLHAWHVQGSGFSPSTAKGKKIKRMYVNASTKNEENARNMLALPKFHLYAFAGGCFFRYF